MTSPPGGDLYWAWLRLQYRGRQLHAAWLSVTGRCSACPKRIRGPHKFGCSRRNSRSITISMRSRP